MRSDSKTSTTQNECGGLGLGLGPERAGLERAGLERAELGFGSGLERGRLKPEPRYILCELVVFLIPGT